MSQDSAEPGKGIVTTGLAADGTLRWTACNLSGVVEEARRRLDLSPVAAVACGRCGAAAAMLLRLSAKRSTRLDFELRGDGPLGKVLVEVNDAGDLRYLVGNPRAEGGQKLVAGNESSLSIGAAVGKGVLKVRRWDASGSIYESQVELASGEVGGDLAHFLAQSEQRGAGVLLGVLLGPEGVRTAGGMIVEALPDANSHLITIIEDRISQIDSVSRLLEGSGVDGAVDLLLGDLGAVVIEQREVRYACQCRREVLVERLRAIPQQQLGELIDAEGAIRAECAYCGDVYVFDLSEVCDGTRIN